MKGYVVWQPVFYFWGYEIYRSRATISNKHEKLAYMKKIPKFIKNNFDIILKLKVISKDEYERKHRMG